MNAGPLDALTWVFLICAVIGGVTVLIRFTLQLLGSDHGQDFSSTEAHDLSDAGFRLLSLHGIAYFFLMFGLVGLATHYQSGVGALGSLAAGLFAGGVLVFLVQKLFQVFGKLQSSGTLTDSGLVGAIGTVYLNIPKNGMGRVTINHANRIREMDALTTQGRSLNTGTSIRVISVEQGVVTVAPLTDFPNSSTPS